MQLERITEHIAAALAAGLDAATHRQGGVADSWHEATDISGDIDGDHTAHLSFAVIPKGSPITNGRRGAVGDVIRCASQIDVVFVYHIRTDRQVEDHRLSMRAARDILRVVNAESTWAGVEDGGDVVVRPRERYRPLYLTRQEPYALVTVGFDIEHDEEL